MMKQRIYIIMMLLSGLLIAGCSEKVYDGIDDERVPVEFAVGNIGYMTRLNQDGTQWLLGDSIGVYMKKAGEPIAPENVLEGVVNMPLTLNSSGDVVDADPFYYPGSTQIDFIAYYTRQFRKTLDASNFSLPVNVGEQHRSLYILYSDNAKGVDRNSGRVILEFKHILSRVKFFLKSGEGAPDITGATLNVTGFIPTGSFNLSDGSWDHSTDKKVITLINPIGFETYYTGILIPQSVAGCRLNVALTDGEIYTWDFPEIKFEAGKEYTYTITVSKTDIKVTGGNITSWEGTDDVIKGDATVILI